MPQRELFPLRARRRAVENAISKKKRRLKRDERKRQELERDPENENGVFPLTDPRVAVAINQISAGLCAATRSGTRGARKIEGKTEVDMTRFMYNCTRDGPYPSHSISLPLTNGFRCSRKILR